ncbi:uncharacterized protein [Primulina eburnea]|uniref:uncharacterized protein n=1 Tax=Primulina eburnea TaxID=1245227 RepID=UPI003C6CAC15
MGILSVKYLSLDGGPAEARLNLFRWRYAEGKSRYSLSHSTVKKATDLYVNSAKKYGIRPVSLAISNGEYPPRRILTFKESAQPLFCDTLLWPALYLVLLRSGNSKRYSMVARWILFRKYLPKSIGFIRHFRIHVPERHLIFFVPSTPFSDFPHSHHQLSHGHKMRGERALSFI